MSFEWQAAQFGVHHDPKSCHWQTKSRSRVLVEHRWKSITVNVAKSTTTLTSFWHICCLSVYRRRLKICGKTFCSPRHLWHFCGALRRTETNADSTGTAAGVARGGTSRDPFFWTISTTTSSHPSLDQITLSAAGSKGGPGRHNFGFLTHN